jgi:hypothetical protein
MYNVFTKEDNTDTVDTTMTNIAALTTGSTIMGVQTAAIPDSVANAINQLSANKTVLMNQMGASSYTNVPPPLQPDNHNYLSNNSTSQCSNHLLWLQLADSILKMEEVAEKGAADRGVVAVVWP